MHVTIADLNGKILFTGMNSNPDDCWLGYVLSHATASTRVFVRS